MVDLFCGMGGFSLAGKMAGVTPVLASDIDAACLVTYQVNLDTPVLQADISDPQLTARLRRLDFQLLTAGFPCQPFSRAGRKQGLASPDGSGQLFFRLMEVVEVCMPEVLLFENVAHLRRHDGGRTFGLMLDRLTAAGYFPTFALLNARDISGLPQNRERLYLVAWKDGERAREFTFPPATDNQISFASILQKRVDERFYLREGKVAEKIRNQKLERGVIYTWRRYYLRATPQGVCPTLLASMGLGGYNVPLIVDRGGVRQLTPRECARLQGYPESWVLPGSLRDAQLYAQIGNSVSVPSVAAIIKQIVELG